MTRTLVLATLMALSINYAHGQDVAKAPAVEAAAISFEVASITPCKPGTPEPPMEHAGMAQFTYPGGRFQASCTTLKFLLEWAYGIQPSQHSDGPSWIGTDRYDVVAKAEGNATDAQIKLMVRTLLSDRFRLKLHHERKELLVDVVSVGKTAPKLFPPKDGETHALRFAPQMGPDQKVASYRIIATRFSLTELTDAFARQLGRVIVNETGLNGDYDFTMDLTPDDSGRGPMDPSVLITGMREQLGLTLKSQKASVDFLVIDGSEKVVAGN